MVEPMNIGIIGCGNISNAYGAKGAKHYRALNLLACADLDLDRAKAKAEEWGAPKAYSVDELLADDDIDMVINLTIPAVHAEIDRRAFEAGKHVYSEKPLAVTCAEARPVLELAKEKGLRLGCAADTFLGAGIQTARKLIDEGAIGTPIAATAFMLGRGHESWHPSPEFYYQVGGGPLLDMGPYYLNALVNLLGPIAEVTGFSTRGFNERTITSEPKKGTVIPVEVDTTILSTLRFTQGAIATVGMSFDVPKHNLPRIEIHGTEGSLSVPDPNRFDGEVKLAKPGGDWEVIEHTHEAGMRGAGPADIVHAIAANRAHRASGDLALHVLEAMEGMHAANGHAVAITHQVERPAAVPLGLPEGEFD